MEHKKFKISNTTIDLGTDGKYAPGSEARLASKLNDMKNGESLFNSLVERGAIELNPETAPVETEAESSGSEKKTEPEVSPQSSAGSESEQSQTSSEEPSTDEAEEEAEFDYEATGRYEYDHYGGGHCNIIDPEGNKVGYVRGEDKAQAQVEELNAEHNL